ncbi:hypothetical protein Hanom_Chr00s000001g01595161 [Helianthus anomalus]
MWILPPSSTTLSFCTINPRVYLHSSHARSLFCRFPALSSAGSMVEYNNSSSSSILPPLVSTDVRHQSPTFLDARSQQGMYVILFLFSIPLNFKLATNSADEWKFTIFIL